MPHSGLIGAFIVLAIVGAAAREVRQTGGSATDPLTTYDDFMKLTGTERRARFEAISAENKAMIVRTHLEHWLHGNRPRLTTSEIAVFEEMAAFVTPEIYRKRPDDRVNKSEEALSATMRCSVSPDDVREATDIFQVERASPSRKPTWGYLKQARCWIDWFVEGLVDYIPSQPR